MTTHCDGVPCLAEAVLDRGTDGGKQVLTPHRLATALAATRSELVQASITLAENTEPVALARGATAVLEDSLRAQRSRTRELEAQLRGSADEAKMDVQRALTLSREAEAALRRDMVDKRDWDSYRSAEETRDTLECGLRRRALEARLGRPATSEDVKAALAMPAPARRALAE